MSAFISRGEWRIRSLYINIGEVVKERAALAPRTIDRLTSPTRGYIIRTSLSHAPFLPPSVQAA